MNTSKIIETSKESRIYTDFLINNKYLISIPLLLSLSASLLTYKSLPTYYSTEGTWEVGLNSNDKDAIDLTDNTIAILRSGSVQQELNLHSRVLAYKPGTLLVTLNITSNNQTNSIDDFYKMEKFITSKVGLKKLGSTVQFEKRLPIYLYTSLAVIIGGSLGIIISLIKAYFKKF